MCRATTQWRFPFGQRQGWTHQIFRTSPAEAVSAEVMGVVYRAMGVICRHDRGRTGSSAMGDNTEIGRASCRERV